MKEQIVMNLSKIISILFLLLGLTYLALVFQLEPAAIGNPQAPKIFPGMVALLTIGLSIALLAQELRAATNSGQSGRTSGVDMENVVQITLISVCAVLYALLFDRLGYVISTILFLEGVLSVFNGPKRWKQNSLVAVIFSVVVYVLFFKILNVYLPPFPFFE
jgi:putative tricarboxylic transport membrane protein